MKRDLNTLLSSLFFTLLLTTKTYGSTFPHRYGNEWEELELTAQSSPNEIKALQKIINPSNYIYSCTLLFFKILYDNYSDEYHSEKPDLKSDIKIEQYTENNDGIFCYEPRDKAAILEMTAQNQYELGCTPNIMANNLDWIAAYPKINTECLVLRKDGKTIAFAFWVNYKNGTAELKQLAVDSKFRGGNGTKIMNHLMEKWKQDPQIQHVALLTVGKFNHLDKFYSKFGFKCISAAGDPRLGCYIKPCNIFEKSKLRFRDRLPTFKLMAQIALFGWGRIGICYGGLLLTEEFNRNRN